MLEGAGAAGRRVICQWMERKEPPPSLPPSLLNLSRGRTTHKFIGPESLYSTAAAVSAKMHRRPRRSARARAHRRLFTLRRGERGRTLVELNLRSEFGNDS